MEMLLSCVHLPIQDRVSKQPVLLQSCSCMEVLEQKGWERLLEEKFPFLPLPPAPPAPPPPWGRV